MRGEGSWVPVIACNYCPSGLIGGFLNPIRQKQNFSSPLELMHISPCKIYDLHWLSTKTSVNLLVGGKSFLQSYRGRGCKMYKIPCNKANIFTLQGIQLWEMCASLSFGELLILACCWAITHGDTGSCCSPSWYFTNALPVRGWLYVLWTAADVPMMTTFLQTTAIYRHWGRF